MTLTTDDAPLDTAKTKEGQRAAAAQVGSPAGNSTTAQSVTINRPRDELFAYWRDLTNLPTFMDNVERIDALSPTRSHWVVKAPGGKTVEWDATIVEEQHGERIAWASDEGADVPNSGRIDFRDAGARGTVVTAIISYDPPAGLIGRTIAKLFQREPAIQARRDLRRFKQLMKTGEVATAAWTRKQLQEERD